MDLILDQCLRDAVKADRFDEVASECRKVEADRDGWRARALKSEADHQEMVERFHAREATRPRRVVWFVLGAGSVVVTFIGGILIYGAISK